MSDGVIFTKKILNKGFTGSVYRFFDNETHADNFCKGLIRISTLEACRGYENPEQGDKDEATWMQRISSMLVDRSSKEQSKALQHASINIHPDAGINYYENITVTKKLQNAYVLCSTKYFNPDIFSESFGKYCVEISNAHEFCDKVTDSIALHYKNISRITGRYSDIHYTKREGLDLNVLPCHIGFLKPATPYASQKEFRFLWTLENQNIELEKLDINCPKISTICKRIK
ncbi:MULTISPECIES: hypothetical protein [Serratia]|uniref:Uncharacterized protein n=1 Tax=Serratia quinivorans TaxID=137545 RepID=A0A380A9Q7_9GAMM|nr:MULTISPECIES: hypothetical protein [Serratia]RYM62620.1 hypothetical protein BSR03_09450 [Serratia proteamaculans]CAI1863702.1 Uncharacterised protein [Serratia quinivorans]SUI76860.1 Uncharacterised protein [Serratia quinivorans]